MSIQRWVWLLLCVLSFVLTGCNAPTLQTVGSALTAIGGGNTSSPAPVSEGKIMLFGGQGHRAYLGCLNCSQYASDSLFNSYGNFGNRYSQTSIFNHYSEFGSPYSSFSACNRYAIDPPVIVDESGRSYGRLTLNLNHPQNVRDVPLLTWLEGLCS